MGETSHYGENFVLLFLSKGLRGIGWVCILLFYLSNNKIKDQIISLAPSFQKPEWVLQNIKLSH